MELAKGWARVGAWVTVGAGAVAALLGADDVESGRSCCFSDERMRQRRREARAAELRYAIACAEAGAVPGGRVH